VESSGFEERDMDTGRQCQQWLGRGLEERQKALALGLAENQSFRIRVITLKPKLDVF